MEKLTEKDFDVLRERMVREQLIARGIQDARIIQVMSEIPRHRFVGEQNLVESYEDKPLPLGPNETISQPYIVAYMLENLNLKASDRVLEVGTGSGYVVAILAKLCHEVYSIEINAPLLERARGTLEEMEISGINLLAADGFAGWPEMAPFDKILVSAAPAEIPRELVRQLKPGGSMVLPLGDEDQELILLEKTPEGLQSKELGAVRFVEMKENP